MAKRKPISKFLRTAWPLEHSVRIGQLRESAGHLPFHERYIAGEFREVWRDLSLLGESVWYDPIAIDALAVAFETAYRARVNVETLIARLEALGYQFDSRVFSPYWKMSRTDASLVDKFDQIMQSGIAFLEGPMDLPPEVAAYREQFRVRRELDLAGAKAQAAAMSERRMGIVRPILPVGQQVTAGIETITNMAGAMPLSMRAWHSTLGGVNLVGSHPKITPPGASGDPLFVAPFRCVCDLFDSWAENAGGEEERPPFQMPVSPDPSAKAGGDVNAPLYVVTLPNAGLDAVLENEGHGLPFVEYLRRAFEWGGFPGYADVPTKAPKLIASLKDGLLPL
jgi:hypothetical protein